MRARGLLPSLLLIAGAAHGAPPRCLDPLVEQISVRLRRAHPTPRPALVPEGGADALVLRATEGELALDWADPDAVEALLAQVVRATRAAEPDHAAEVLALFTARPARRAPFYLPLGNDVRGIGYGRLDLAPAETFRSAVDPRLKGVAFLGDLPAALADPVEAERLFLHELGHRWGVYVHLGDGGDALLGRNCRHWSAFVDSGDSPLEGHRWRPDPAGWRAVGPTAPLRYAPLTRYLMGLIPIDQVPPIERLAVPTPRCGEPERDGVPNPRWTVQAADDPPWVVAAERTTHAAAQVVAAEGPRAPAWPEAPTRWVVRFVVLAAPDDPVDQVALATLRRRLALAFMRAAGAPAVLATGAGGAADVPPPDQDAARPDLSVVDAVVGDQEVEDQGPRDAGPRPDGAVSDRGRPGPGGVGGCQAAPGPAPWGWALWALLGLRPRRRPAPGSAAGSRPASPASR